MKLTPSLIACAVLCLSPSTQAQTAKEVAAEMRLMREELRQLRAELDAIKKQKNTEFITPAKPVTHELAHGNLQDSQKGAGLQTTHTSRPEVESAANAVNMFGYGELSLVRPKNNRADTVATARRGVLGFGYRFNERTRFAAELEIENAVVSAGDQGEAAFEQLYVEHDIDDGLSAKMGLFLLPIGYMNETHEPTRYFGVTRNLVETAIIPTTWREMGLGLRGTRDSGWRWDAGVVTSFDLNKWPTNSADSQASPLGAIHQEGQLAKAASLAYYGALNFDGIPGVNFGGSLFQGGIGQKQNTIASPNASVTLAEIHTKWQVGAWDLSALVAQGHFHDVSAFNASTNGIANPVPDQFRGWYAQAAYRLWRKGDYSLVPFARYERVNTALGYSGVFAGQVYDNAPESKVITAGASYYLHPQVVLKMDMQKYQNNSALDRLNMGVGFHY